MAHKRTAPEAPARARLQTRLHMALAFVLLGVLVAAGAFLPARIAERLDGLLLEKVEVQALAPDEVAPSVTTSLIDRLKLLSASPFELATLPLKTGGHLNEQTAQDAFGRELEELRARGLYPPPNAPSSVKAQAGLYALTGQPDVNGIIWTIDFEVPYCSGRAYLDDESGKILSYTVKYDTPSVNLFTAQSGELWMDYLGLATDRLRLTEETGEPSENDTDYGLDEPAFSLGGSLVFEKTDALVGIVLEKRIRFLLETGGSPLEISCEQFGDGRAAVASLRVASSKKDAPSTVIQQKPPETDQPLAAPSKHDPSVVKPLEADTAVTGSVE
jgi:hypothetical protein